MKRSPVSLIEENSLGMLHSGCRLWDESLTDGAEIRRLPTVEEASAIKFEDLRQDEKYVLMNEIRKVYYKDPP